MDSSNVNYSPLNNYQYGGKSTAAATLDLLSTPARRVLGGRTVSLLHQTEDQKMSTARKVATIVFSVLIFPIAIVSIASLLIKLATNPYDWEKKKVVRAFEDVNAKNEKTNKIIEEFNSLKNTGETDKAL